MYRDAKQIADKPARVQFNIVRDEEAATEQRTRSEFLEALAEILTKQMQDHEEALFRTLISLYPTGGKYVW